MDSCGLLVLCRDFCTDLLAFCSCSNVVSASKDPLGKRFDNPFKYILNFIFYIFRYHLEVFHINSKWKLKLSILIGFGESTGSHQLLSQVYV